MGPRANAVRVVNADLTVPCRSYLGCMYIGGGGTVAIFKAEAGIHANRLTYVSAGNSHEPSHPIEVDGKLSTGQNVSQIVINAAGSNTTVLVYYGE